MLEPHAAAGALTPLETALAGLLEGLAPVEPELVSLADAVGCVASDRQEELPPLPPANRAEIDGWAFRSLDLTGSSAFSPLPLAAPPVWVEAGETLPEGCDCVLDPSLVERAGAHWQAIGEAAPGQGVRRAGEDFAAGRPLLEAGRRIAAIDLLLARSHGVDALSVRRPVVRIVDVASGAGGPTAQLVLDWLSSQGAYCLPVEPCDRDAPSIAKALRSGEADLVVLVGGTGAGKSDETAQALAADGTLIAHGIALSPGQTTAVARAGKRLVVALPGLPGQAFGACLALVDPVLRRLSAIAAPRPLALPLARKITSTVGMAEVALVRRHDDGWMPLAVGDLPLGALSAADAWLLVPAASEGHSAGSVVGAFRLREKALA
ncbi:molybdopterin-binding protein [Mesorhizobium xinjiangense]|uniref:molybdopterin-binding protein n=1 Tax=Mesorhizobium xinjiangense TaxID=2678685 RepID=UPI0012EEB72C|nr:molybdopterin-binding protein [Mesorhizobium xinjiangense]